MSLKIENLQQLDSKQLVDLTVDEAIAINGGILGGDPINGDMEMWKRRFPELFPSPSKTTPRIPRPRILVD